MFHDLCSSQLIEFDFQPDINSIKYFSRGTSDGIQRCAINKCKAVNVLDIYDDFIRTVQKHAIYQYDVLITNHQFIVCQESSSSCVKEVYCHVCLNPHPCQKSFLTDDNNVVCMKCINVSKQDSYSHPSVELYSKQKTFASKQLRPFKLTSDMNYVFLDTYIGWYAHPVYVNSVDEKWFKS